MFDAFSESEHTVSAADAVGLVKREHNTHYDMEDYCKTLTFYANSDAFDFVLNLITPQGTDYEISIEPDKLRPDAFTLLEQKIGRSEDYEPVQKPMVFSFDTRHVWRQLSREIHALENESVKEFIETYAQKENGSEVLWFFSQTLARHDQSYGKSLHTEELAKTTAKTLLTYADNPFAEVIASQIEIAKNHLREDDGDLKHYCKREGIEVPKSMEKGYFELSKKAIEDKEISRERNKTDYQIRTEVAEILGDSEIVSTINSYRGTKNEKIAVSLIARCARATRDVETTKDLAAILAENINSDGFMTIAKDVNPDISGYTPSNEIQEKLARYQ